MSGCQDLGKCGGQTARTWACARDRLPVETAPLEDASPVTAKDAGQPPGSEEHISTLTSVRLARSQGQMVPTCRLSWVLPRM